MHERQRPAGLEDPRGRQQISRSGCLELVEACEARRPSRLPSSRIASASQAAALCSGSRPSRRANRATDRSYSAADLADRLHELTQKEGASRASRA